MAKAKKNPISVRTEAAIRVKTREAAIKKYEEAISRADEGDDTKTKRAKYQAMRLYNELFGDSIAEQVIVLGYLENLILHGSFKAREVRK